MSMIARKTFATTATMLAALVVMSAPAPAADGTIAIDESGFNEFAAAIQPLPAGGTRPYRKRIGVCPFCKTVTLCSGEWSVSVTDLTFTITTDVIRISGQASGTYHCHFVPVHWTAILTADADVTYSAAENAVVVRTRSAVIEKSRITVPRLGSIPVGIRADFTPSLTLPPFPVTSARLRFESSNGAEHLRLTPRNVSVRQRSGYLELQSDVKVW